MLELTRSWGTYMVGVKLINSILDVVRKGAENYDWFPGDLSYAFFLIFYGKLFMLALHTWIRSHFCKFHYFCQ